MTKRDGVVKMRTKIIGALVCTVGLALAGCSSSGGKSSSDQGGSTAVSNPLRQQLPSSITAKGELSVATDGTIGYPYAQAQQGSNTLQGLDVDLANALAQSLGLKAKVANVPFASLIPGIQSGRYDISISVAFDTPEREKVVDIVDFLKGGSGFLVRKDGGPTDLALSPSLCGLTVGVLAGGVEGDELKKASTDHCQGAKPIVVQSFPSLSQAVLALQSSRVAAVDGDSIQNAYITKQNPNLQISGQPYGVVPIGMIVPKSGSLSSVFTKALQQLIDNGQYSKILQKWGVSVGAVQTATLNGAE